MIVVLPLFVVFMFSLGCRNTTRRYFGDYHLFEVWKIDTTAKILLVCLQATSILYIHRSFRVKLPIFPSSYCSLFFPHWACSQQSFWNTNYYLLSIASLQFATASATASQCSVQPAESRRTDESAASSVICATPSFSGTVYSVQYSFQSHSRGRVHVLICWLPPDRVWECSSSCSTWPGGSTCFC